MGITYDDTTIAALPGGIIIDKTKFLIFFEITGIRKTVYSMILSSKLKFLNKIFPKNSVVQEWISLNEHFQYGCANPTIIINKSKGIYATYTDLTNDIGDSTPVIKIVQIKNSALKHMELRDGNKTVTVSMYFRHIGDPNARTWSDFEPLLPHVFSNNVSSILHLQEKIKAQAWECLKLGLEQIEDIEKTGLYHVKLLEDLTKNAY